MTMKVTALQNNRNPNEVIAKLTNGVIAFFEKDSGVLPGQTVEVMITGCGKQLRDDGYPKVVFLSVVNPNIHFLCHLRGFATHGGMCQTYSSVHDKDESKVGRIVTPGRCGVYNADQVLAGFNGVKAEPIVPLQGWVITRPGKPAMLIGLESLSDLDSVLRKENARVASCLKYNEDMHRYWETLFLKESKNPIDYLNFHMRVANGKKLRDGTEMFMLKAFNHKFIVEDRGGDFSMWFIYDTILNSLIAKGQSDVDDATAYHKDVCVTDMISWYARLID